MSAEEIDTNVTQNVLIGIFARVLRCNTSVINPDASFDNLGIDSLLVLVLFDEVKKEFCKNLSLNIFFECRTISELAKKLG